MRSGINDTENKKSDLERSMRRAKRALLMAIIMFVVIMVFCIAWFIMNNRVDGTTSSISAKAGGISLATLGPEENGTEDSWLNNTLGILKGNKVTIDGKEYYATSSGTIRMNITSASNMNNEANGGGLMPGSSGELTFYVIANKDISGPINCQLKMAEYVNDNSDSGRSVVTDDEALDNLTVGHIMFFRKYNSVSRYEDWINNNEIIIKASDYKDSDGNPLTGFKKNNAYPVTIYWVWPKLFDNYVQTGTDDCLFSDDSSTANAVRSDMITNRNKYFYGATEDTFNSIFNSITDITNTTALQYSYLSEWYNAADYYLGSEMDYLYLEIENRDN